MKIFHVGLCVNPPPLNAMQKAFIDNSSEYREISTGSQNLNENILQIAKGFRPDLVFFQIQSSHIVHPETVYELKRLGAKIINWTGDVRHPLPKWFYTFGADITLFSNMKDVIKMRSTGYLSDYLEIGYDENIYCAEGEAKQIEPIVFFGNNYGSMFPLSQFRVEMIDFMKLKFGDKFGVYGNGWTNGNGNFNHSQREEAAAYRGSKIAINLSHFEIERYNSDRILRIMGTGCPICLTKKYPSIEKDYSDSIHLYTWDTLKGLEYLCNYYLDEAHEPERKFVAQSGMNLVRSKFTFDHMIKEIIKIYNQLK